MRRALALALALSAVAGCNAFCNRRVFEQVEPTCDVTIPSDVDIPAEKAADILIVVDNSGSMQEEQDNLAANFLNPNVNECPIPVGALGDFARCDDENPPEVCRFANPAPEVLAADGPEGLAQCGFIQVLAAFENDFRVGVITTDVGLCDNRFSAAQGGAFCAANPGAAECTEGAGGGWGYRPQRGCLQPNGPPGTTQKIIARADLLDDDPTNDDIGGRFSATLRNIRTFGTPFERGLDAMKLFLDPEATRGPGCEGDLDAFLRDDAKLVVIFLTDEEDCSRLPDNDALDDEFSGETCDEFQDHFIAHNPADCYDKVDELTDVKHYADFLRTVKDDPDDVSLAIIAGGLKDGDDVTPGGCTIQGGNPVGGCFESGGSSNATAPGGVCSGAPSNAAVAEARQCAGGTCAIPCCVADGGSRYFALADELPEQSVKDSICFDSFRQTMIKIAVFIADVDKVQLAEPPSNPALIFVEKAPAGSDDFVPVQRLEGHACGDGTGWVLEADGVTVRFCGNARPGPGERIRVRAKGAGADPNGGADACANRD